MATFAGTVAICNRIVTIVVRKLSLHCYIPWRSDVGVQRRIGSRRSRYRRQRGRCRRRARSSCPPRTAGRARSGASAPPAREGRPCRRRTCRRRTTAASSSRMQETRKTDCIGGFTIFRAPILRFEFWVSIWLKIFFQNSTGQSQMSSF